MSETQVYAFGMHQQETPYFLLVIWGETCLISLQLFEWNQFVTLLDTGKIRTVH